MHRMAWAPSPASCVCTSPSALARLGNCESIDEGFWKGEGSWGGGAAFAFEIMTPVDGTTVQRRTDVCVVWCGCCPPAGTAKPTFPCAGVACLLRAMFQKPVMEHFCVRRATHTHSGPPQRRLPSRSPELRLQLAGLVDCMREEEVGG